MTRDGETTRQARVDAAVAVAVAREGLAIAAFVRAFYRHVPWADVAPRTAENLAESALSLWRFAAQRTPSEAKIRALAPAQGHGVVEIVNDDMPFLVDSVGLALSRLGLEIDLLIHPVIGVRRDAEGRLLELAAPSGEAARESMMRVEILGELAEDRHAAVVARLDSVLADVRRVTGDASEMRAAALVTKGDIVADNGDTVEDRAFLEWLAADNFLFLGTREYTFASGELEVVPGIGRGLLRRDDFLVFDGLRVLARSSPDVQAFLRGPQITMISKSNRNSTVHRPVAMDTVMVKLLAPGGAVAGLRLFLGLFTQDSYGRLPHEIPVLRQKVRRCEERSGFDAAGRDGKAFREILDNFPRDELFQIDESQLFETAIGVLHLKQRPRVALFVLRDPFERFVTCLVYMPRDRFNAEAVRRIPVILEQAFDGGISFESTHFEDAKLARIHFVIATSPGGVSVDVPAVERKLAEGVRTWTDRLSEVLVRGKGDRDGAASMRRYASAFPPAYVDRFSVETAVADMKFLDAVAHGAPVEVVLSHDATAGLRLKTFHLGTPLALSDVLPILENLGFRVVNEIPFEVAPRDVADPIWLQEFELLAPSGSTVDVSAIAANFEDAFRDIWTGRVENDGFNRLVLAAGMPARDVMVLRAYRKLLRQTGGNFSHAYMEDTASAHPDLAGLLVSLFRVHADPAIAPEESSARADAIRAKILAGLESVENLDEDRILRNFLLLIEQTLRTNFFQRDDDGTSKPYLSIKLASREIDLLPLPRPLVEIFVYSPRMEGCHLRGGKVARGGIRWSDRKEDFRTEILGLMKAQMVKNAVIVPVGSKGGFVVKRPPEGGREALMAEVVACYKTLMWGLLDLTDDFRDGHVVPPRDVVRHDGDDTYLVVAADKGTATFSDIANGVAVDRGFWLGDAFASGGSVGYDHKVMGITAKGAWEAVKRHFREIGTDIQTNDFSCVGVGDMSGDVFGNGMLLSRHTRLIAAFNHVHIFIDPDPDPARTFDERMRLFHLPRSAWSDFDSSVISKGGGIYERRAKAIVLSLEARARFGLKDAPIAPAALIQALLRQQVDLLWFGGIGTYVKASDETHADAGDRANDSLRVNAAELRAKVVGEGANLAVTQRARIEFALAGGRLNTDAIDNSAGVDTSDHEVNIKIAVGDMIAAGKIPAVERAAFLASLTDEVEALVLADNYLQTLALSLSEAEAPNLLDSHARLMRDMERRGRLNRAVEFLPDDDTIAQRAAARRGLTRPELSVLLAYAKMGFYDELLASDLPDAPELSVELFQYFPGRLRALATDTLNRHRLRREIICTCVANALVNRLGPSFVADTQASTGRDAPAIAAAYLIVRDVFDLPAIWRAIEALDNLVSAASQARLFLAAATMADQAVRWFLLSGLELQPAALVARFGPGITALAAALPDLLPAAERAVNARRVADHVAAGAPAAIAERIVTLTTLSTAMAIVQLAEETGQRVLDVGKTYFTAGSAFGLLMLRRQAREMPAETEWQRLAADALIDDSFAQQSGIARHLLIGVASAEGGADAWISLRAGPGSALHDVLAEIARTTPPDLAMLTVASRRIRSAVAS